MSRDRKVLSLALPQRTNIYVPAILHTCMPRQEGGGASVEYSRNHTSRITPRAISLLLFTCSCNLYSCDQHVQTQAHRRCSKNQNEVEKGIDFQQCCKKSSDITVTFWQETRLSSLTNSPLQASKPLRFRPSSAHPASTPSLGCDLNKSPKFSAPQFLAHSHDGSLSTCLAGLLEESSMDKSSTVSCGAMHADRVYIEWHER